MNISINPSINVGTKVRLGVDMSQIIHYSNEYKILWMKKYGDVKKNPTRYPHDTMMYSVMATDTNGNDKQIYFPLYYISDFSFGGIWIKNTKYDYHRIIKDMQSGQKNVVKSIWST